MVVVADGDTHGCLLGAVFADCGAGLETDVLEFAVAFILVEKFWRRVIGDVNIRPAGVVEVGPDHAKPVVAVWIAYSGGFGYFGERAVAIVVEERVAGASQSARAALHVDAAILAEGSASEAGQIIEMKIDVVGDHEIDKSIAVVVAESGAGRPSSIGDAGLCRHVGKGAVAVVAIENVAAQAGDIEIGPAVVVVVSDGSAHGEARSGEAGFCRHVGESAVVIVVVENAEALRAFDRHLNRRSIGEIDVGPAIAIIVQQNHSAAHGFHNVFLCRVGGVFEGDAGLGRDVLELRNRASAAL